MYNLSLEPEAINFLKLNDFSVHFAGSMLPGKLEWNLKTNRDNEKRVYGKVTRVVDFILPLTKVISIINPVKDSKEKKYSLFPESMSSWFLPKSEVEETLMGNVTHRSRIKARNSRSRVFFL
ncbi:hypothetical protein KQX54_003857 [Cotesia glomerata]|uniref:Uncharacterized protein n=1 Tax=Cotesia glomerata TaxID=32391 RepID=A0AAV7I500_COTGL|nr:hypothetical protein KQX54_003857 [Cotesia glomerata]